MGCLSRLRTGTTWASKDNWLANSLTPGWRYKKDSSRKVRLRRSGVSNGGASRGRARVRRTRSNAAQPRMAPYLLHGEAGACGVLQAWKAQGARGNAARLSSRPAGYTRQLSRRGCSAPLQQEWVGSVRGTAERLSPRPTSRRWWSGGLACSQLAQKPSRAARRCEAGTGARGWPQDAAPNLRCTWLRFATNSPTASPLRSTSESDKGPRPAAQKSDPGAFGTRTPFLVPMWRAAIASSTRPRASTLGMATKVRPCPNRGHPVIIMEGRLPPPWSVCCMDDSWTQGSTRGQFPADVLRLRPIRVRAAWC